MNLGHVEEFLESATDADRDAVLRMLRDRFELKIHPLEARWNTKAETILEAIDKSSDLTQRGIRGVLAEASFRTAVAPTFKGWIDRPITGDLSYDLLLEDRLGPVRVQVKLQRREKQLPKLFRGKPGVYVVETQRTRTGKRNTQDGEVVTATSTRPYRVDDFDLIAVCLQPSTGSWHDFLYCPTAALLVRPTDKSLLAVMQPIHLDGSSGWTTSFEAAVAGSRSSALASTSTGHT